MEALTTVMPAKNWIPFIKIYLQRFDNEKTLGIITAILNIHTY